MEGFKEFQGKDLDDAIGQACTYYDTLREKLEIEIISDSKSGIFGIVGARKAKIKARRVQVRSAVDSILGRSRDGADEEAPAPTRGGRAAPQDKQAEKLTRTGEARTESRATARHSAKAEEQPRRPMDSEYGEADCAVGNDDSPCARKDERDADGGRKSRNQRPARNGAAGHAPRDSHNAHSSRAPRDGEGRSAAPRHDEHSPEFRYDGNSILSGQVLGYTPELEDDEQASFGPGNELPSSDSYGDRQPKPRRGRNPRPAQGRPENSGQRSAPTSILAGTLDGDALNEDALSEGLPVVAFDQLDQERLSAISLEAVGRLVAPIVGDVPLAVELGDNRVNVVLDCGDDSGLLIGREGQTLASLQYLASRLVSRAMGAAVRVQLDAGEYRLRQDEKLRDLALSLADRVRATGKSHSTRPLSSYHRRIVHMALQEAGDIQTRSSGEGALKRVVIQKKRGN